MNLETRFASIIAFCCALGVAIAGMISYRLESRQASEDIRQRADLLLETAMAVRTYTVDEVAPVVKALQATDFHPAQVPSYAAQNTMNRLTQRFAQYRYRESSLNPTNVQDRASDWEVGIIRQLQADRNLHEVYGEHATGNDLHYFVARPIRLNNPACLQCHSTPQAAPESMLKKYGPNNGFGWRMGDVVGIQLVEVPESATTAKAYNSVLVTVGSVTCVLVLSASIFLLLLRRYVTTPLEALTRVAHASSLDQQTPSEHWAHPTGQFSELHAAILRLRVSLSQVLDVVERGSLNAKPKE